MAYDERYDGVAGLDGLFSNIGRAISKAASDTRNQIVRQAHWTGKALDNQYVKAGIATGLAFTGVGVPLAAGIMAAEGAAGGALKKGGGLREATRRGYQGAVIGASASVAGTVGRKVLSYGANALARRRERAASDANGDVLSRLPTGIPKVGTINDPGKYTVRDALGRVIASGVGAVRTSAAGKVRDRVRSVLQGRAPTPIGVPGGGADVTTADMTVGASPFGSLTELAKNPVVLAMGVVAVVALSRGSPSRPRRASTRRR